MTNRDPQPQPPPRRRAYLPPQSSDFTVEVGGRPVPWLACLVSLVLAPIFRWRMRRGWRPRAYALANEALQPTSAFRNGACGARLLERSQLNAGR